MKCAFCYAEIKETFLGKLKGTVIKKNENGKNKLIYSCSECQKEQARGKIK